MTKTSTTKGQSLIELLIAIGLSVMLIPAIFSGFAAAREGRPEQSQRLVAIALAKEGLEATRSAREAGWENIATNGDFHPEVLAGAWSLLPNSELVNQFTRTITIEDVLRDASGDIVEVGGTVDPLTKKVTVTVSWPSVFASSVQTTTYLGRHLEVASHIETTQAEFDLGTHTNTVSTNTSGGEVQLGGGGNTDWCAPALTVASLDLPKQGVANAISAIEGRAFVGTGENASGVSFANIDITNTNPPVASILDTADGYKTNDVFGEPDYAYLATDSNQSEIAIIDLTASPYNQSGSFDSPGPINADAVYVVGNIGYAAVGNKLFTFDLTDKTGSRPAIDSDGVTLSGVISELVISGTNAYVTVNSSTQLEIVDATDPANLVAVASAQVSGGNGVNVFVNDTQTRAYLVVQESASQDEFFVLDITTKTGQLPVLGSYDSNGMDPTGVAVVPGNIGIVVGQGAEEYQVLDLSSESVPNRCGGLELDSGINGVATVLESDGDAYSYLITGDAGAEFRIIEGGPGGSSSNSGNFESAIFDATNEVAFHRTSLTFTEPLETNIRFQVGVADAVGGVCTGVTLSYVGPDGTASTFFEDTGKVPVDNDSIGYENPGQCFGYKVYFDTNEPTTTPILFDVTTLYSQ